MKRVKHQSTDDLLPFGSTELWKKDKSSFGVVVEARPSGRVSIPRQTDAVSLDGLTESLRKGLQRPSLSVHLQQSLPHWTSLTFSPSDFHLSLFIPPEKRPSPCTFRKCSRLYCTEPRNFFLSVSSTRTPSFLHQKFYWSFQTMKNGWARLTISTMKHRNTARQQLQ